MKSKSTTIKIIFSRLCATPHQPSTCPVQAYLLYATHRPPQCNTPQSPFFLTPRSTNAHHIWYKSTAAGKNLELVLQKAIQNLTFLKQITPIPINEPLPPVTLTELPPAKRIKPLIQPLNLFVTPMMEDDSGTASNSSSNDILSTTPVWDESVTEILLTVAKQRDTRIVKINTLRGYLEEKLGFVEFLCLYRGFKSEPKLTFHGTPWEHYQRFLPVLFTLLTLDNTTV
jgi:hypothetical protein